MSFLKKFRLLLAGCGVFLCAVTVHAEFYVASNGDDSGSGTIEKPFATLARARDAIRSFPGNDPKRIVVRGGKYFAVRLALDTRDSGLTVEAAPGEKPVLYGGVPIMGWRKTSDKFYSAPLPENYFQSAVPNAKTPSRLPLRVQMLQVNEKWALKARYPAAGTLSHLSVFKVPWLSTEAGGFQRKPTQEELTSLSYKADDISPFMEMQNAELTIYHMWDESSTGVAANDTQRHIFTLAPPATYPPGAFNVNKYVIWNTAEGMTAPGHWFHDRKHNSIVYWPLQGEDMATAEVIAPISTTIIRMSGTIGAPIKNVYLKGLTISVTNTPMVSPGFAAGAFDGAVSLDHAENCNMEGLTIKRVGGQAINTLNPCMGIKVKDCEIEECGAGGIYVSGTGATITNNNIHDVGMQYSSGVGMFRGGWNFVVSHNEIHGTPYSAICFGGGGNVIENNLIYDSMKVLHDGAAIYLSGAKKCDIRGNLVRNIGFGNGGGASAFYLDEQCEGCVVENNASVDVTLAVQNHIARDNLIRNNVFVASGDVKLGFTGSSNYTLEKNIVYARGKISILNIAAIGTWSKNVLYSQSGVIEGTIQKGNKDAGVANGLKGDTSNGDPLFQNPDAGDYNFKPGSPALQKGIQPLDMSGAGREKTQ